METRANYIAVGLFTLVALVVALALVFWFGRYNGGEELVSLDIRIQGSVSGLGPGSDVRFNGIEVGRVSSLSLDAADPRYVIVQARINKAVPVRQDTRATIGIRGLSGGAFIALEGGSRELPSLLASAAEQGTVPQIEGDPAALSDLIDRVNVLANRTEAVMETVEQFVKTNSDTVSRTLSNAETFSKALADNSEGVNRFLASASGVAESLENLSTKLDGSITQVEAILTAVEPESIRKTLKDTERFVSVLAKETDSVAKLIQSLADSAARIDGFTQKLGGTLDRVDVVVAAVDPEIVRNSLKELDATARKVGAVLAKVDPATLGTAVDNIAATASDTRRILSGVDEKAVQKLVDDLAAASTRLSGIAASLEPAKVTAALNNIEQASRNANNILGQVDPARVGKAVEDISEAASATRGLVSGIDQNSLRDLMDSMGTASKNVSGLLSSLDGNRINEAVGDFAKAAEGAQQVVEDVSKVTGRFAKRGDDFDAVFNDAVELAERLNAASKRVDNVLVNLENVLGSGTTTGIVEQARETLVAFRRSATNLDRRINEVSAGITRFTSRGLGDTQSLIRDVRQSINRIDRVIRNIESNPSALISGAGGSRIKESSGTRPRR